MEAIEWADRLVTDAAATSTYRDAIIEKWKKTATAVWAPSSSFVAVSTSVKILRKGTPTLPTSIRYVHQQMERSALAVDDVSAPAAMMRDIIRTHCLKTFSDPRPICVSSRRAMLFASSIDLFTDHIAGTRSPALYKIINEFVTGVSNACPLMRFALNRHSVAVTVGRPTPSYTAILRRILTPKCKIDTADVGVSDGCLTATGAARLRLVTAGGTSKRVKSTLAMLDDCDIKALKAAITSPKMPRRVGLSQLEVVAQAAMPPKFVMWCSGCKTWRCNVAEKPAKRRRKANSLVLIDLSAPKVGVCASCGFSPLALVPINGQVIGDLRLCSMCGEFVTNNNCELHKALVVCKKCCRIPRTRVCAKCGGLASGFILAVTKDAFVDVWLCPHHHPGHTFFDPLLTSPEDVIKYVSAHASSRGGKHRRSRPSIL